MVLSPTERLSDTISATQKLFVSVKCRFDIRATRKKDVVSIYLIIQGNNERERINLDLKINPKDWDKKNNLLKDTSNDNKDINLYLKGILSKINEIQTNYRLRHQPITPLIIRKELKDGMPRVDFVKFFELLFERNALNIKKGTLRRYHSVFEKIKKFRSEILFSEIDQRLINDYIAYCRKMKNKSTTINSNLSTIKAILNRAKDEGIRISIAPEDIKVGSTQGNKQSLSVAQTKALLIFNETTTNESWQLISGYFLFACFTGLRYGDVMAQNRNDLFNDTITFVSQKSEKHQTIRLNENAKQLVKRIPLLFIEKYTNEYINRELKHIQKFLGVKFELTFHIARHTFATSFLKAGGSVEKLQKLLAHSNIRETMIYVHILAEEANEDIMLLDDLFK
jgi:integrase